VSFVIHLGDPATSRKALVASKGENFAGCGGKGGDVAGEYEDKEEDVEGQRDGDGASVVE